MATKLQPAHPVDADPKRDPRSNPPQPPKRGGLCPNCGRGKLDYNGLLELECPLCGCRTTGGAAYT